MRVRIFMPVCLLATTLAAAPAVAHHNAAAHYLLGESMTIEGVVTEFRAVNPHARIYFEAVNAQGEREAWMAEGDSFINLRRSGWTADQLKPGDRIEIGRSSVARRVESRGVDVDPSCGRRGARRRQRPDRGTRQIPRGTACRVPRATWAAGRMSSRRSARKLAAAIFLGALAAWPLAGSTHHSFPALLTDEGEEVIEVLDGTVRVFRLLNPHGALIVDVPNAAGESEGWLIELSPAAQLAREGWTEELLDPGDPVSVAIFRSQTPNRGRIRAVLAHGKGEGGAGRLLVSYGIRGDTPVMRRLRERLPTCGIIDQSYERTECFRVDADAERALAEEFPGPMGYVMPVSSD